MEIIQEIGSYAGFAAVIGLAVLSALYFSQARDVKRLREWAGRAPERTTAPAPAAQPQRVVAQPIQRPAAPAPPVPRPPAVQPAQASATGAKPAVASGPAPATAAAASAAGAGPSTEDAEAGEGGPDTEATAVRGPEEQGEGSTNGAEAPATPDAPAQPEPSTAGEADEGDASGATGETDAPVEADTTTGESDVADAGETREWRPEDEHAEADFTDEHDVGPATPLPPQPPRPYPRRAGTVAASRQGRGPLLPPYSESRPGTTAAPKSPRGRRPVLLAIAGVVALAIGVFAVLQVVGSDDSGTQDGAGGLSANPTGDGGDGDGGSADARIDPSTVTVAVLNGTTQPGLAAQIGDQIAAEGFVRGVVTNNFDQERAESVVLYAEGAEREAVDVSRRLDIPQREPIDSVSQDLAGDATVVVVAGADQIQ